MKTLATVVAFLLAIDCYAGPYDGWKHSGSVFILTTPVGADLPAGSTVENFPLLVRLHGDSFPFGQAHEQGADLRIATGAGEPLVYQIESWDAARGEACVWVRVPVIQGNDRQELRLFWGKPDATDDSNGGGVFGEANGYAAVWHMAGTVRDEVGTLSSQDKGTTATTGVIGGGRHFPGGAGVSCGTMITTLPTGPGPHSTGVWFRATKPNTTLVGWGNEEGQGKVVMQYRSPPRIRMDCYFSGGDVASESRLVPGEWTHVVHSFERGEARVYVNGRLDGRNARDGSSMAIKSPARLWLGGWYDNYDFVGDLDEVRLSRVVRSPEWVRLEYENQKPLQTLVGPVVPPGSAFSVSTTRLDLREGQQATLTAEAGGARKVSWILVRDGVER
ncbi:MAG: DUF2341 domain-containing protein, partial [Planctomycetia bacterium]